MIIKFDESAFLSAGWTRVQVEMLRHMMRQLGDIAGQTTLPEVAAQTDVLTPVVNNLQIVLTATNGTIANIVNEATEHRYSDTHALTQRLDTLEAELERGRVERAELMRIVTAQQDQAVSLDFNIADLSRRIKQLQDAQS